MKLKPTLTRPPFTAREMIALTALLAAGHAVAAPAAKPEEKKDKKKEGETQNLGDLIVEAVRTSLYKPEKVTSKKYTQPLLDTPQTVTVVPKQVIEEQGATSLTDVLRNVPGISIQAGEGGGASSTAGDAFTMRGFNGSNSVFVDGVRDDGLGTRDTFNLEAVEVFLGPTGSDVGRGTASGYVNLGTKTPKTKDAYAGSVAYGTNDRVRTTADINQSLSSLDGSGASWLDGAAFRLNGLYQTGGVPGRDDVERNSFAIAPSLAFGLETDTRLFLSAQYQKQDNLPDYGVPSRAGYPLPGVDPEWFYGLKSDFEDVEQKSFTARLEHDFSENLKITNQTRYSETDRLALITSPSFSTTGGQISRSRQANLRENSIFSNQTIITGKFNTGVFEHSASGGIEYTWDGQDAPGLSGAGTVTPLPFPYIPNPYTVPTGYNLGYTGYGTVGSTDTIGLFLFDSIKYGEHWVLTGGIRSDSYDTDYRSTSATVANNIFAKADDTLFSGKVGLTYKPVKEGSIYIGYGTSQTPPGTGNFALSTSATNQNNPNLDPQESENIELGVKWDFFKSALTLTGAVFHTENTNVIYVSDSTTSPATYSVDGGQEINGATVGVAGKITENWSVLANATIMHAELDQPGNPNNGKDLTLTPELSGSLWTTYKLPYNFTVGGGVRYQESVFVNAANTLKVPSYAVVDALVQYDLNENVNFRLNVFNALDREYRTSVNNNGGRYNPGTPASFLLSTNFKF